jgi:transposase
MEQWAKRWLEEKRRGGERCLEIKVQGKNHYVYRSTTHWDKELKKPKKTSKYIGKLDPESGIIKPKDRIKPIRNVTEYGNSMLLHGMIGRIKPLLMEGFPDYWEEIYVLTMVRSSGSVPLKRVEEAWDKLYNVEGIHPDLKPKNLSRVLRNVGVNRDGQNLIFRKLADQSNQLVYDLTSIFSRSVSISQAERGYNKDKIQVPQINLALLCSVDTGLPTMIRSVPGSVKDIKTLYNSIRQLDIRGKILILDRGFFSDDVAQFLRDRKIFYVLPVRRNSLYYDKRIHLNGHFYYHDRLIRCGKRHDGNLYLFEDQDLMLEERKTLYRKLDEKKINRNELKERMKKAGRILILSNLDVPEEDVYELYKKREGIEKMFDTYKTVLDADKLYLQDDESVFGHVFVSFLSLYIYCKLEQLLKGVGLNSKITPVDLLFKYSRVYHIDMEESSTISEVPKKVKDLDEKLELDIFPK